VLTAALQATAKRNPDRMAIAYGRQSWTYSEFDQLTSNFARNLLSAGIAAGDRVALHFHNCPEFAFAIIGCLKAGCIVVPINPRLKGPEIDYVLRHSGSAGYIGQPELFAELERSCPAIENLTVRYLTDQLLRASVPGQPLPDIHGDRVGVILYTSGTTAHPKGVIHTHTSLLATAECMRDMRLDETQVVLIMSSMAHLVGLAMLLTSSLLIGASVVITRPLEFNQALETYERWRCTYTLGFPVTYEGLVRAQAATPRNVSSARIYFCGGDCLSPALQEKIETVLGPVSNVYGATEIAPVCWVRPDDVRVDSMSPPAVRTDVRLVTAAGGEAGPDEVGEVWVRGPHLTIGYWMDSEAKAAAFRDGRFRTGDLARLSPAGHYYFAGRVKEIIIRGGSNVSPQEVEAALYEHPAVHEAGVIGSPDAVWGETVTAYVALRAGSSVTESELIAFARQRLADYKTPERIVFLDRLPQGPSGKIQRRSLKENSEHGHRSITDPTGSFIADQTTDRSPMAS
jgi:long-chain acyl-CoA synthetase